METIEVTARWEANGEVTPLQFRLQGLPIQVETIGRRWRDDSGLHALVKAHGGRTFELVFSPSELKWFLAYQSQNPNVV